MRLRALLQDVGDAGTTADAVHRVLRQAVVDGAIAPGERLRSDALANELRVSRTPVREALRKLEAEGLVQRAGAGLVVRSLSERDLTEVFYVREALEGMAARLAAENATPDEIADIRHLIEDMDTIRRGGDVRALRRLTAEFHQAVCRASRNGRLLQSLQALLDHARASQSSTLYEAGRPVAAIEEHRALLRAIEARDGDRAEQAAREHRRKTLELRKEMLRREQRKVRAQGS